MHSTTAPKTAGVTGWWHTSLGESESSEGQQEFREMTVYNTVFTAHRVCALDAV